MLFLRDDKPDIPSPNCWSLPGGGIEDGETPLEAMKRELTEEITHAPRNLKFLTEYQAVENYTIHLYYAFAEDDEVPLFHLGKGEGQKIEFFDLKEIPKLKLPPVLRQRFENIKELLAEAMTKKDFSEVLSVLKTRIQGR